MRHLILVLASLVVPALAHAEPAVSATTADQGLVEINWSDPVEGRTRLSLALPPHHSCSSVEIERDRRSTYLTICRQSPDGEPPLVEFKINRVDQTPQPGQPGRTLKLQGSARLRRGAQVVIGRFEPTGTPSGAPMELLATLR
jgi:hypothetical protein